MNDKLTREQIIKKLVDRFLVWPLPDSVCSDLSATKQGYPHRSGTTLLSADEAKQMIEHLLIDFDIKEHPCPMSREQIEQHAYALLHDISTESATESYHRLLNTDATLRQRVEELTNIIRREAWLEYAANAEIPGPYVPWDDYKREVDHLTAKLAEVERERDAIERFVGCDLDNETQTFVSGKPPYLSGGRNRTEAVIAAVGALRLAASTLEQQLATLTRENERLRGALEYLLTAREIKCLAPNPRYCGMECAYHRAQAALKETP